MEVLAAIVGAVVGSAVAETGRLLRGCFDPCSNFQPNLDALENKKADLIDLRNKVKQELEAAEIDGKQPTSTQLKEWVIEVEGIELKVNSLQAGNMTNNENLCRRFLNCTLRYRLGRQVAKMLNEVERLLEAGMVEVNDVAKRVQHIPGPSIEDQTTASMTLAKIMDLLSDDGVRRIGIWGMGGVGKTTLVTNLNNKLKSTSLTQPFGMVIWVTVSKELDLRRVQTQIAERLEMQVTYKESLGGLASPLYERLMTEKKFLLILDDVWETIDLESLGIPPPEIHSGYKIILTSRSTAVCEGMMANAKVKVEVLTDEEAWQLFIKNAGDEAKLENIEPIAKAVAKECDGLPLAIITVGRAMRGKKGTERWRDAVNELRESEPSIAGTENKAYSRLKWSYDSLQGKNIKPCFLYCSLFPEDFSIEVSELVQCWMAEGLIDEKKNYENSLDRGMTIIENLKDSCLLENGMGEGTVKMHDVVRDVAIWIAFSMEDGCKSLVRSGIGLSQISEVELLKSCERISFMNNKITTLPDCEIQCPKTSTVLLQGNRPLERVTQQFLLGFQKLRVLNMSRTSIRALPPSLSQLGELRALVLRDCKFLKELPPLGGLRKLQVLDLFGSRLRELPEGMGELSNLRQLNLSCTKHLKTIQAGVLSSLSGLEVLHMLGSGYKWGTKGDVEEGKATIEELGCLEQLAVVHMSLPCVQCLDNKDVIWIEILRSFRFFVGSTTKLFIPDTKYDERQVILRSLDLSENGILWPLIKPSNLYVEKCRKIGCMFEYLDKNRESLADLKSLAFGWCDNLGPFRGCAARHDLLPNLEELHLWSIKDMQCVEPLIASLGLGFSRLRLIDVSGCQKLKYLIPHEMIPYLINLEQIKVIDCKELEEILQYCSGQNVAPDRVLPKLRILELVSLPNLKSICREKESWQSLEQLTVIHCNQLERLPLTT